MGATIRHEARPLSAFEAMLPLAFTATAIIALGFGVNLAGRPQPAPVAETSPLVSTMSKRQEAKLAADMSAFALTKVAPERLVAEATPDVFMGPALPPFRLAQVTQPRSEAKVQRKPEKPAKVASVLPPPRPAIASPPPVVAAHAPERGIVARVAEYVPSPRRMVDGVWTLGGRVASYIPRI